MGILSKLKDFMFQKGFEDEYYYEQDDDNTTDVYAEEDVTPITSRRSAKSDTIALPSRTTATRASLTGDKDVYTMPGVSLHFQIVHANPTSIESTSSVCDLLKQNKAVIVNMEGGDVKEGQRIMDFLAGVTYAIKGDIFKVSERIFMVYPESVEVTDQHKEQLRASGVFSGFGLRASAGR